MTGTYNEAYTEFVLYLSMMAMGFSKREAAIKIRAIARLWPELGDLIPDEMYAEVYHVRARGTMEPETSLSGKK
jgi:hypothetical protein